MCFTVPYNSNRNYFHPWYTYSPLRIQQHCRRQARKTDWNVIEEPSSEQNSQLTNASKIIAPKRRTFKGTDNCAVKNRCHLVQFSSWFTSHPLCISAYHSTWSKLTPKWLKFFVQFSSIKLNKHCFISFCMLPDYVKYFTLKTLTVNAKTSRGTCTKHT